MAAHMQNARLNPLSGYENDVCIYVKPHIKRDYDFHFEGHPYLDMVDGFDLIHALNKYPDVPAIVFSDQDVETVSQYIKNKIICIPHQHVNFERDTREIRDKIVNVGIIGSEGAFKYVPEEIKSGLADRGMRLHEHFTMFPRSAVTKFYLKMDLMLVWRPYNRPERPGLYNPFKIVNASAFGLPTIALDERAFLEMKGCYFGVENVDQFFERLDALRASPDLYNEVVKTCLRKSERYHIDNIAKLYTDLCVPYK